MSEFENEDESGATGDASFRKKMSDADFKPDAGGMKWGPAQPKVLVAGAYKVMRTAAEKARSVMGKTK